MPILTPEERVGSILAGKYRLERIVAGGGMATVYAGVHEWTHRTAAVKILNYEYARDEEIVRRFLQEARAAAQLKHPNVVDVLDMGRDDDGTVYLVMELLEGETLKGRMKRGTIPLPELFETLAPVMRAVESAHRKGVVHRDLKPDNVFLARAEDGTVTPKLLDFGIAKVSAGEPSSTRTGTMVGTPHYMAPEQARGERDVGPPADVWSMGVVLYACIAGRRPFEADSLPGVLAKVLVEEPPPLRAFAPHAPAAVAEVITRALRRDPAERWAHMGEMVRALEEAIARGGAETGHAGGSDVVVPAELAAAPTIVRAMPPEVRADDGGNTGGAAGREDPSTPFVWEPTPPRQTTAAPSRGAGVVLAGVAVAITIVALAGGTLWAIVGSGGAGDVVQAGAGTATGAETGTGTGSGTVTVAGTGSGAAAELEGGGTDTGGAEPVAGGDDTMDFVGSAETAPAETETAPAETDTARAQGDTAPAERETARAETQAARAVVETEGETGRGARAAREPRDDRAGDDTAEPRRPRRGTRGALILR